MKQTLKDFLTFGLNKLSDNKQDFLTELENGEKYIANDNSDLSGTLFKTKKEAIELYRDFYRSSYGNTTREN